jgi:hypothetical protein
MEELQRKQVILLTRGLGWPEGRGRHAAICLAKLVKLGEAPIRHEALESLITVVKDGSSPEARKWAAWALGGLAGSIEPHDLSYRVVPALIRVLHPVDLSRVDLHAAGQAYHSLLYIGTPDAVAAAERYKQKIKAARKQQAASSG